MSDGLLLIGRGLLELTSKGPPCEASCIRKGPDLPRCPWETPQADHEGRNLPLPLPPNPTHIQMDRPHLHEITQAPLNTYVHQWPSPHLWRHNGNLLSLTGSTPQADCFAEEKVPTLPVYLGKERGTPILPPTPQLQSLHMHIVMTLSLSLGHECTQPTWSLLLLSECP